MKYMQFLASVDRFFFLREAWSFGAGPAVPRAFENPPRVGAGPGGVPGQPRDTRGRVRALVLMREMSRKSNAMNG